LFFEATNVVMYGASLAHIISNSTNVVAEPHISRGGAAIRSVRASPLSRRHKPSRQYKTF